MKLHRGNCIEAMKKMEDNSVHAIITDPPYELRSGKNSGKGFMGKEWDTTGIAMRPEVWEECLRVAKPGAFLLSFGGTRTFHRVACAIEDAGWVMVNTLNWLYGSGFPKNADISRGMDKSAGARRRRVNSDGGMHRNKNLNDDNWKNIGLSEATMDDDVPVSSEAEKWNGFGTALKPAWEPVLMFQKPIEGAMSDEVGKITGWKRWYIYNGRWSWIGTSEQEWKGSDVYKACKKHGLEWWEEEKDKEKERFIYRRRWDSLVPWGQGRHSLIGKNGRVVLKRWPYRNKKRVNNVANILKWGVGGLNLGGCKIGKDSIQINRLEKWSGFGQEKRPNYTPTLSKGRWASNTILSHSLFCEKVGEKRVKGTAPRGRPSLGRSKTHVVRFAANQPDKDVKYTDADGKETVEDWNCVPDCPVRMLDEQSGLRAGCRPHHVKASQTTAESGRRKGWGNMNATDKFVGYDDKGGASRFFYCTKVMPDERNAGLDGFEDKMQHRINSGGIERDPRWAPKLSKNDHPTVKPIPLLRYLCRLVTPPGGTVLDCFVGSGSTGCAAVLEGLDFIGIEKEEDYFKIAEARIKYFKEQYDAACK